MRRPCELYCLKELVFWGWWSMSSRTPLCCFTVTVHLFSQSLSIILRCGHLLLNVIFLDESILSLCLRRHVAALCMLYKVNSNSNHCLFSELPSASVRVRQTRAVAAAGPLEFEVSKWRTSQFARWNDPDSWWNDTAQTRVWNDLPYTVFDTGTLDGFQGAVNRCLLPWVEFFSLPWRRCLWGI